MKFGAFIITITILFVNGNNLQAQYPVFRGCPVTVDFSKTLRDWDGFGFNYVETAQTVDYSTDPKDYGGFSIVSQQARNEITDLIFGEEGLKVALVKMFLDPFHQAGPGSTYDHEKSTASMRLFVRKGLEKTHQRASDLQIITTLYGPPAYMTLQKTMRGRDLDSGRSDLNFTHGLHPRRGAKWMLNSLRRYGEIFMKPRLTASFPGQGCRGLLYGWVETRIRDALSG